MLRRRKSILAVLALLSCLLFFQNCTIGGPSASSTNTAAGSSVGINTRGGWSDSPFISRDGNRLYFMYSRYNFAPWMKSGGATMPVASGPDRPGLHKSATNPWDESDIYVATRLIEGGWSEPVALGLNGDYGDSSGMEIDNGNTFIWLRGDGSTNNIVMATKNSNGSWNPPQDFGAQINSHSGGAVVDNPYLSPDGTTVFFVSDRSGGSGGKDIWFSSKSGANWTAPVNVGSPFNTNGDEDQPWISLSTGDVYWNGPGGLMHCVTNGSTCTGSPDVVTIPGCAFPAEVSMPDDGQTMYFACGDTSTFEIKIMYSFKQPNGSWGQATPVD